MGIAQCSLGQCLWDGMRSEAAFTASEQLIRALKAEDFVRLHCAGQKVKEGMRLWENLGRQALPWRCCSHSVGPGVWGLLPWWKQVLSLAPCNPYGDLGGGLPPQLRPKSKRER